jgi:hypothetical protein
LLGAYAAFTWSDAECKILNRLAGCCIECFLDHVHSALFAGGFNIKVSDDGEIQRTSWSIRADPFAGIVLIIEHPWMAKGLEQCRYGAVGFFSGRATGFKNSGRMKVWHMDKECPCYRDRPVFSQGQNRCARKLPRSLDLLCISEYSSAIGRVYTGPERPDSCNPARRSGPNLGLAIGGRFLVKRTLDPQWVRRERR